MLGIGKHETSPKAVSILLKVLVIGLLLLERWIRTREIDIEAFVAFLLLELVIVF